MIFFYKFYFFFVSSYNLLLEKIKEKNILIFLNPQIKDFKFVTCE